MVSGSVQVDGGDVLVVGVVVVGHVGGSMDDAT